MRKAFIETLSDLARKDPDIMLLTGDLGFSVFEDFMRARPKQYLNCGVAEQNMMGMAAGLAMSGKKVFAYSIIPFITMRCLEQVRDDVCLHNLNVKLIGVGGGYSYGQLGPTHHALEDVAVMRSLPNMKVLVPADPVETRLAIRAVMKDKGPAYIRLGKSKENDLHAGEFKFAVGRANVLRKGKDAAIIGVGPILEEALRAADILGKHQIDCGVVSMTTVKPLDGRAVAAAAETGRVFTLEEHSTIGGLGDAVGALIAEKNLDCEFKKIGVEDMFLTKAGDQEYLRAQNRLTAEGLAGTIRNFFR